MASSSSSPSSLPIVLASCSVDSASFVRITGLGVESVMRIESSTPLQKMMRAWCLRRHLPLDAVTFTAGNKLLQPSDTPAACGWPASDEESTRISVEVIARLAFDKEHLSSFVDIPTACQTSPERSERLEVQLCWCDENGAHFSQVKMWPTTPFRRMLTAWCSQHRRAEDDAKLFALDKNPERGAAVHELDLTRGFEAHGLEASETVVLIVPAHAETLASVRSNLRASSTNSVVKQTHASEAKTQTASSENLSGKSVEIDTFDIEIGSPVPKKRRREGDWSPRPNPLVTGLSGHKSLVTRMSVACASKGFEKYSKEVVIHVRAADLDDSGGFRLTTVRMKPTSILHDMMQAWCERHSISIDSTAFFQNEVEVDPKATPRSSGWEHIDSPVVVWARPKQMPNEDDLTQPAGDIELRVVSFVVPESPAEKLNLVVCVEDTFKSILAKICAMHSVHEQDVKLVYASEELEVEQSPVTCGFLPGSVVQISLVRKDALTDQCNNGPKRESPLAMKPSLKRTSRQAKQSRDALANQGNNEAKQGSPLTIEPSTKSMSQQGIQSRQCVDLTVVADDLRESCFVEADLPGGTEYAKPKKSGKNATGRVAVRRSPTTDPTMVVIDLDGVQSTMGAAPRAKTRSVIHVDVAAETEDASASTNMYRVSMPTDLPLQALMNAWYKHQGISPGHAKFLHGDHEIGPEQTPESCGWSKCRDSIRIQAVPNCKEEPEDLD